MGRGTEGCNSIPITLVGAVLQPFFFGGEFEWDCGGGDTADLRPVIQGGGDGGGGCDRGMWDWGNKG